jgi:hypothetical protein
MSRDPTDRPMHLLLVAPFSPPMNSPEAMQVGRFLAALDPAVRVTLVTTPIVRGWQWEDATLAIDRPGLRVITPSLPAHSLSQRVLANHRLAALHVPDSDFWFPWFTEQVAASLDEVPDVIYSRSAPFSAALMAQRLKRRIGKPWMMHLSDPWSGSPYRAFSTRRAETDRTLEAVCIANADLIALTTEGQAEHYRVRYPDRLRDITVTPNMMPLTYSTPAPPVPRVGLFRIVYTGALYGEREPSTLLTALRVLRDRAPDVASQIAVDFYGNMQPEVAAVIEATPGCTSHGTVSFDVAAQAQAGAHALLTIEPGGKDPLLLHFMPSKNLDYMACRKMILAITPAGSETARLCSAGHGWVITPGDFSGLADLLFELARTHAAGTSAPIPPDPQHSPYRAEAVTASVLQALQGLAARSMARG